MPSTSPWNCAWCGRTLVLTGPTGSGKTSLGLELAEKIGAEIVSMDSMAIYRGLDIGTAKPTAADLRRVSHHLIDVLEPWESGSVAWWLEEASRSVRDIHRRGKIPLIVGGTPLYLKAMLFGLFNGPPRDNKVRRELEQRALSDGNSELHKQLAAVDPHSATRLHPNDVRRVVRALEVWRLTGRPISSWQQQWHPPAAIQEDQETQPVRILWLDLPRPELYERINQRVEAMMAAGFLQEVDRLRQLPKPLGREARQAVGYQELLEHLDGQYSLDRAVDRIKTRTRQFAKRQITWFRHLPGCRPASRELTFALWGSTIGPPGAARGLPV